LEDERGESDDWIELYNAGPVDLDIGGMHLSDNFENSTKYAVPAGTIVPAGGYLILWTDGDGVGRHLNFKLSGAGEYVGLFDSQQRYYAPVDAVYFPPQEVDVSWGRFPDGSDGEWYRMDEPTPGGPNRLRPPVFLSVARAVLWPEAGERVTVTAVVTAGSPIVSVTAWYDVGGGFQSAPMTFTGAFTGWQLTLPAFPTDTLVSYYVEAVDSAGQLSRYPPAAPAFTLRYLVGYAPPTVVINEFLAANRTVNTDEAGEYDDWLELYNGESVTVTLDGFSLSDDLTKPSRWAFPSGVTIPPGGHLLVWCDRDVGQGPLHADFKLDRDGEEIGLFVGTPHGPLPLDWIVFGAQQQDVSYGRQPDGVGGWRFLKPPTPGWSNG
jgi:hypothetical protein